MACLCLGHQSCGPLEQIHTAVEQFELLSVCRLKSGFPRMNRDKSGRSGSVLMVSGAQRQNFQVRARFGASVYVMNADKWLINPVHSAGYAAKGCKLVMQPFL